MIVCQGGAKNDAERHTITGYEAGAAGDTRARPGGRGRRWRGTGAGNLPACSGTGGPG